MKKLKRSIMLVLVLLSMFATTAAAQASSAPDFPKEHYVLEAISLLYAPTPDHRSDWNDAVCQRMTDGGCAYFRDQLESRLWQSGQGVTFNGVIPGKVIAALQDGSQVWKTEVAIQYQDHPVIESDIYLHVVFDVEQDKWLLNRVLYGPHIDFPKFEEQ